ncbi:MAG TPA: phosphate signaling complex protein PhoU [Acidimicrobiales bacterium]|nr:phosphate signaling complex protein PhoU [Acidimicrobiales bacterium]
MPTEIRKTFHQELDQVRDDLIRLAGMVTEALAKGTAALLASDLQAAEEIIAADDEIDELALDIEERCVRLLALQNPLASDLRQIIAGIRMTSEIERSADLVTNTMKAARRLYGTPLDPRLRGLIEKMSEHVHRLFRLAIDAYADQNEALAAALDDMDDDIDELHADYIRTIFEVHEGGDMPLQVSVQLALVGRYYERIGDHAVNIGERVRYMCSGWLPEHTGAARLAAKRAAAEHDAVDGPE